MTPEYLDSFLERFDDSVNRLIAAMAPPLIMIDNEHKITINEAAKLLKRSPQAVRVGMQQGKLDIGTAYKDENAKKWTYVISPKKLHEFYGSLPKIESEEVVYEK